MNKYDFIVERKRKQYKHECYFGELEKKTENMSKDTQEELDKKAILKKYIEIEEFKNAVNDINISQLSRFYSLLEKRNFSFESGYIKDFVKKQMERDESKKFYEYFEKHFLNDEFEKENKKNKMIFEMIKKYIRYNIGQKKLEEKKGEN